TRRASSRPARFRCRRRSARSRSQPSAADSSMPVIDVNTFIGPYPFRHVPHPEPEILARVLEREGVQGAWVGHLPSAFYRDPTPGNEELQQALAADARVLRATPVVRPDWPKWERTLARAAD